MVRPVSVLSELGHGVCHPIDQVTSGSLKPGPVELLLAEKQDS